MTTDGVAEKKAKSFHILDETEEDLSIAFIFEDGTDVILVIPKTELTTIYKQLVDNIQHHGN